MKILMQNYELPISNKSKVSKIDYLLKISIHKDKFIRFASFSNNGMIIIKSVNRFIEDDYTVRIDKY